MKNVVEVLSERGFIENTTHDVELKEHVHNGSVSCYIGFDPTAASLHVGSLVPIMALAHMQRHGHRPIALVGGGTGLVGDPSGKTEMRQLLTRQDVEKNAVGIKRQLARFIDFENGRALLLNNADWLTRLNYIDFLRDFGRHFSVNRMIKAESYKLRLASEEGLSFIEFNYMVLQAYDFLELFDRYDCRLQMGGSDQWGNIVAGIDLIRRVRQKQAFGMTFPLITTSSGAKMGKTAQGAVWLDAQRTSAYDYYQFWINTDDPDVRRFLALFTFLPLDEIQQAATLKNAELNFAKAVLAFEATSLVHGRTEAVNAFRAGCSVFGTKSIPTSILPSSSIHRTMDGRTDDDIAVPQTIMDKNALVEGIPAFKLFKQVGLVGSGGAGRRLIEQGGAYINGRRLTEFDYPINSSDLQDGEITLKAGKKRCHKIKVRF